MPPAQTLEFVNVCFVVGDVKLYKAAVICPGLVPDVTKQPEHGAAVSFLRPDVHRHHIEERPRRKKIFIQHAYGVTVTAAFKEKQPTLRPQDPTCVFIRPQNVIAIFFPVRFEKRPQSNKQGLVFVS